MKILPLKKCDFGATRHDQIMKLHQNVQQMTKKVRDSQSKLDTMKAQRDESYENLAEKKAESVDRSRPETPRPDWPEAQAGLMKVITMDLAQSTKAQVSYLTTTIASILTRTVEARDDFTKHQFAESNKEEQQENDQRRKKEADEAGANKKWLLCLGRGSSVPSYLRATGKVQNKNLSRSFVRFLHQKMKILSDSSPENEDSERFFTRK